MKLKIEIDGDNAAFGDSPDQRSSEVVYLLRDIADRIESGEENFKVRDSNGNVVGKVTIE